MPLLVYVSKCMFSFVFLLQLLLLPDMWLQEECVTDALWVSAVTSLGLWKTAMTLPKSVMMMDVFLNLVKEMSVSLTCRTTAFLNLFAL